MPKEAFRPWSPKFFEGELPSFPALDLYIENDIKPTKGDPWHELVTARAKRSMPRSHRMEITESLIMLWRLRKVKDRTSDDDEMGLWKKLVASWLVRLLLPC